ncbi:slipin family protein [Chitinophaga lutea]
MKRINIEAHQVGLVYRRNAYRRMLTAGSHWLGFQETIQLHDTTKAFHPTLELNIYLQDEQLEAGLNVVTVGDHEIALHYENGLLKEVLPPGRYAYWKGVVDRHFVLADTQALEIPGTFNTAMLQHPVLQPYLRKTTVESHQKALLFIDGVYQRELAPGVYYWWKNATILQVLVADSRPQQLEVNGQEILTRDKAALRLNAWVRYQVTDVQKALRYNKDFERQLYILVQLRFRETIAALTFDELLETKDQLSVELDASTLGVEVLHCGVRDIILPGDVKDIMNQVLVAEKKAQANIITRREETASTRSLLNTAKLMEDNPMLFRLKEMEYIEKIAERIGTVSVHGNGGVIGQLKQLFAP